MKRAEPNASGAGSLGHQRSHSRMKIQSAGVAAMNVMRAALSAARCSQPSPSRSRKSVGQPTIA